MALDRCDVGVASISVDVVSIRNFLGNNVERKFFVSFTRLNSIGNNIDLVVTDEIPVCFKFLFHSDHFLVV